MDYEFSKLLLKFSQAFIQKDVEQLKTIAGQLKECTKEDEQLASFIDVLATYSDTDPENRVDTQSLISIFQEAGIENYESFIYYLEIRNPVTLMDLTVEEFKAKPFYQFFMGEQKHINEKVGFSFNSQMAFAAVTFKDPALISEVLNRIEQIESQP